MNDYKFRGLNDFNNEFEYGSLLRFTWADFIVRYNSFEERVRIKTDSIGQFTGFNDRIGIEIYGGDIVRFADKNNYIVGWDNGRWVCDHTVKRWGRWGNLHRAFDPDLNQYDFRVIGNIHQNPNLLNETP